MHDRIFTAEQLEALRAPLDSRLIKTREQANQTLSYLTGYQVIEAANQIFGFGNWDLHTVEMRLTSEIEVPKTRWENKKRIPDINYDGSQKMQHKVGYAAHVRVIIHSADGLNCVIRERWGAGEGINDDLAQAHESALKEAETDALKRALATGGNPFGLALYDKDRAQVVDGAEIERIEAEKRAAEARAEMIRTFGAKMRATIEDATTLGALMTAWLSVNQQLKDLHPEIRNALAGDLAAAKDARKVALQNPAPDQAATEPAFGDAAAAN